MKKSAYTAILSVCMLVTAFINCVLVPGLSERVFDALLTGHGLPVILLELSAGLLLCAAFRWAQGELRLQIIKDDTKAMQKKLLNRYLRSRNRNEAGSHWIGYICKTAEEYQSARLQMVLDALTIFFSFLFLSVYICFSSPLLFLAVLIPTVLLLLLIFMKNESLQEQARIMGEKDSEIMALQWEYINHQEISRFLNYEKLFEPYIRKNGEKKTASLKLGRTVFLPQAAKMLGGIFLTLCIAFIGGRLCGRGALTMPQLFGVLSAVPALTASLFLFPSAVGNFYQYRGLKKVLPVEKTVQGTENGLTISPKCISATDLSFHDILRKASLSFTSGELHMITGESGCGKTTLLKLLLGLYEPEEGQIKFDGEKPEFDTLRKSVFYFSAAPWIPEKIRLRDYALPRDTAAGTKEYYRLIHAFHMEHLDEREALDMQKLSEGEKQKIMFVKMFLSPRNVWMCDEPTNKLDAASENEIMKTAAGLIRKRNILAVFVSHRPSTVQWGDSVWKVQDGTVICEEKGL